MQQSEIIVKNQNLYRQSKLINVKKQENITLKADTQCQATTTRKSQEIDSFPTGQHWQPRY